MKYADETRADFVDRIRKEKGFGGKGLDKHVPKPRLSPEEMKAESEAIRADMIARHDARFLRGAK